MITGLTHFLGLAGAAQQAGRRAQSIKLVPNEPQTEEAFQHRAEHRADTTVLDLQGQAGAAQQAGQEATTAQRVEAGMAVLRNSLPGLSMGSLRNLLERAQGDVLKALSGLAQQELAAPPPRQQVLTLEEHSSAVVVH